MADSAANTTNPEAADDFEVILDTGDVVVIRENGVYVAQVQSPVDLGELGWQLASVGYVAEEMIAFPDGVVEMQLRPLGAVPLELTEQPIVEDANERTTQREEVYA